MNMMDGRLKGRGLMWAIIWIMNESRRTMIRSLRRRRSMRWRRMSVVYSGWPWMPIIWSPYLNISIPVFSDHPMISAFGGSSLTSSLWHSIMESLAGSFSVEKKLDDDDDDKWTVLNPMSHPDPALPVFPPSARPSICPTPHIQHKNLVYYHPPPIPSDHKSKKPTLKIRMPKLTCVHGPSHPHHATIKAYDVSPNLLMPQLDSLSTARHPHHSGTNVFFQWPIFFWHSFPKTCDSCALTTLCLYR